jgi:hypothetical protein
MKKQQFLLLIVIIILVTAVILRLTSKKDIPLVTSNATPTTPNATSTETIAPTAEVIVTNPQPEKIITSPLIVEGEAKGNWFFEANLPVKLVTLDNQVIAVVGGQAESDWMTDKLVPFKATLNFTTTATSGYLVVSKDNPSGLPQNDASFKIPVRFK